MKNQHNNDPEDRLCLWIRIVVPAPDRDIQLDLFDPPPSEVVIYVRTGVYGLTLSLPPKLPLEGYLHSRIRAAY